MSSSWHKVSWDKQNFSSASNDLSLSTCGILLYLNGKFEWNGVSDILFRSMTAPI